LSFSAIIGEQRADVWSDYQHNISKILLGGKLSLAPVDNPKRVLDLGTGTGIWAIEYGETFWYTYKKEGHPTEPNPFGHSPAPAANPSSHIV
jgi:hypothetical protein